MLFRALDFAWNACEMDGLVWGSRAGKKRNRPWWFGSWLLHACVFDRDCFPDVCLHLSPSSPLFPSSTSSAR